MSEVSLPAPDFDISFQRGMLKLALNEDYFASQLTNYLRVDHDVKNINIFNTKQLKIIFDCIVKSVLTFKTRPSDAQVRQYISEFAPEEQPDILRAYQSILDEATHDESYFRAHIQSVIQQVKMAVGFYKIQEHWKKSKLTTPDVMQEIVDSIRRIQFEKEDILTLGDIDKISLDAQSMLKNLIPTGLAPLDKDLLGGLPREGFVVVLGGTNTGKSLFTISLAANAIRTGHKVLHIALEGMRNEALMRYTANLTGVPIRGMMQGDLSPAQKEQLNKVKDYQGNLRIINMLSFGVKVEDLAAKAREVYKEFKFDMFVVDYSQLLDTNQKTEGTRQTQTYVHRALAAMAREFNCVVVSPIQATRDAQKEQTGYKLKKNGENDQAPILRSSDISEDINIARVAAVILTLNRTENEAKDGKLRVFLEKQRLEAKDKLYGVFTKFGICQLITADTYDPKAVTQDVDIFAEMNSPQYTSAEYAIKMREQEDKHNLRKKINDLISQQMDLRKVINDEVLEKSKAAENLSEFDKAAFQTWLDAEDQKIIKLEEEIKMNVKIYYPSADQELYKLTKESLKDAEKSGTTPTITLKEIKERVRHLSYLFD